MDRQKIVEAIEACRPDSRDSEAAELASVKQQIDAHPELAKRRAQVEQWDRAIQGAVHDVPVPEGLQERLLAVLQGDMHSAPDEAESDSVSVARQRGIRRRWLIGAALGVAAAAAGVMITVWLGSQDEPPLSAHGLAEAALSDFSNFDASADMKSAADDPPDRAYRLSHWVTWRGSPQWRGVTNWLGRTGVVYDLGRSGASGGWLFILDASAESLSGLPTRPPDRLDHQTAGRGCALWQENGKLCLLIIDGDLRSYDRFIKSARMA